VVWIADFEAANSAEYSESGQRADPEQNTTEGIDQTHCPSIKPPAKKQKQHSHTAKKRSRSRIRSYFNIKQIQF